MSKIIIFSLVIIIFTILIFLGLLDIYNERKNKLKQKIELQQIQNETNQYKHKFEVAKAENAKLNRIKISNDELKGDK